MKQNIASKAFNDSRVHDKRSIVKFAGEQTLFTERQPESVQINYHNRAKLLNGSNLPRLMTVPTSNRQPIPSKTNSYISTYKGNYEQPETHPDQSNQSHHRRPEPKPHSAT